ncbi:MAG: CoA-disulfide reductase, partial [Clostridia bacterium]|nr:CoA-disulfide reductase [Clostridia bacterium]
MKVVIIGGVAGGATAAARLRRLDEKAEIIIFERSGYISYANCGLPYYIGGVIEEERALTLQSPKSFFKRYNVNVKVRHEVTDVNITQKTVTVKDLASGNAYEESYDKLILSPGAKAIIPDFCKAKDRVFTLRTVEDTQKIRALIEDKAESAVIIGGGFVGLEMAENLKLRGLDVTVVEQSSHLLNTIDGDIASFVHSNLRANGVKLLLSSSVREVREENGVLITTTDKGALSSDLVVLAIGVTPDTDLAKKAGLKLGIKGAIRVDGKMQTSAPDVYAVGDAVEVKHFVTEKEAVISLAGPANKQGRIVADNICGLQSEYNGSQGSSVIKLFDMTIATTGITETACKSAKLDYEKVILSPPSHAGYYPDGKVMTIKLLYEKATEKILGAQIVGYDGVDKRIDVIATAMRASLKVTELAELDLAYAPPYSSAKDPVNMAGFIAENIASGLVKQFHYEDIPTLYGRDDVILLDTRTITEYEWGHADGFIHIPLDDLRNRLGELDKNKKIYVMCQSGLRSYIAVRILVQHGYDAFNFSGGYRLYASMRGDEMAKE